LTENIVDKIKKEKADYVIIVDTPGIDKGLLKKIKAKILIIDHHVPDKYENVVYCNPRLYLENIYWPASYLCYHIYEKISGKKYFIWIGAAGVLGDHGVRDCKDLFDEMKDSELIRGFELNEDVLYESKLGLIVNMIDSGRVVKGSEGATFVSNTLVKLNDYKELLEGKEGAKEILEWHKTARKEFERLAKDFEKHGKLLSNNIILYELKSKLRLKSTLASALANRNKDKILVIIQDNGKHYAVSMRKGDDVNTNLHELIRMCIKNIPDAEGGGHPEAVGGKIPKKYLDVFLKNLASK
jgi:single-stranded DNA-specific DHH superfamily exonuclease